MRFGITGMEEKKQENICSKRYSSKDGCDQGKLLHPMLQPAGLTVVHPGKYIKLEYIYA
jgi:hypothetical protein